MKRRIIVLLLSMFLFTGVFLYGAYLHIDQSDSKKRQPSKQNTMETVLNNVWIVSGKDSQITYFEDDQMVTVDTAMKLTESIDNVVGDITMKDGKVQKVTLKPEQITGKVITIDEHAIQLETDAGVQNFPLSSSFKLYRNKDGLKTLTTQNILVGYDNVKFIVAEGELCAGIVEKDPEIHNIRVLLKTTKYKDDLHDYVTFSCTSDYTIQYGKARKTYKAKKKITLKPSSKLLSSGRVRIKPKKSSGKIEIHSIKRTCGVPAYRGVIEIGRYENKLTVINELSMEEYLYAVIPSEMPTNYGAEALKVQAVCARTYVYKQLTQNVYSKYGAHVDDSVASQVYNNIAEDKNSIRAVKDTYGEIMLSENDVIEAYYFSTSWGCTADAKDVWLSAKTNYLEGQSQVSKDSKEKMQHYDFSSEAAFKKFLKNKSIKTYDSTFPWYRWNVTLTKNQLEQSIEKNLKARYEVNPNLILTLSDNNYVSQPIEKIGVVKDIEVANRTKSGLINEIIIKGSDATVKVCSEYNIRLLLAPVSAKIKRNDNSKIDGLNMMPSAFFMVQKKKNTFFFQGGGYGHGVGMSQNGAKAMADAGFNYSSILQHYYNNTTLGNLYL